jgi:hypothetical protein
MMSYETQKVLVKDHRNDLNHSAVVARLVRRVRRNRRQDGQLPDSAVDTHVELPSHISNDHAIAA